MVTAEVFSGDPNQTNQHFKGVGLALGLVRIKDLHMGKISDLKQLVKESIQDDERPDSKS